MTSLLMATLCSASIALIFKKTEGAGLNRYVVTTINYLTAAVVSILLGGIRHFEFTNHWIFVIGIPAGILFFLSFVWYQVSVKNHGAGLAGMFGKLGILMPVVLSLIIWKEWPSVIQMVAIMLSVMAILLVQSEKVDRNESLKVGLLLLFLFGGLAEFSNKIFQQYGSVDAKSSFFMVVFATAGLLSMLMVVKENKQWGLADVGAGIAVGIPNLFSSWFLIKALILIPATVAFPIYSAGSMALIMLFGGLLFKEKLSSKGKIAFGFTLLALLLMNL